MIGSEQGVDLIELLCMSAVGSFHLAVEFGGTGWKHKEAQTALPASFFEDGREFTAAIDLQGAQGKRQTALQGVQEQCGGRRGGPAMDFDDVPA